MHPKVFACLLISALIGTSLSRSLSESNQEEDVQKADQMKRRIIERFIQNDEWPTDLTEDQKHLVSQFLPQIYASELPKKEDDVDPGWTLDYGRRSVKD